MVSRGFLGEIELISDSASLSDFEHFESLPNIRLIHRLATEFAKQAEIMPYQREGEATKLIVNVYLKSKGQTGPLIAVLLREDYPNDVDGLRLLVQRASARLERLASLSRLEDGSLASARKSLEHLLERIAYFPSTD